MLVTHLDDLCNSRPISRAIKAKFNVDIAKFTEDLNDYIHNDGDLGYEDAEKYNLMVSKHYTETEAQNLLDGIQATLQTDKYDVKIKGIDKIPHGIASELAKESRARSGSQVSQGDIRYGLLRCHELIGYVCGEANETIISISGLYVREDYRKKGLNLGRKLLTCMMEEAESKGLEGISLSNATWAGQSAVRRLSNYYDSIGKTDLELDIGNVDHRDYAELRIKQA